jgi:hypothetical protein
VHRERSGPVEGALLGPGKTRSQRRYLVHQLKEGAQLLGSGPASNTAEVMAPGTTKQNKTKPHCVSGVTICGSSSALVKSKLTKAKARPKVSM